MKTDPHAPLAVDKRQSDRFIAAQRRQPEVQPLFSPVDVSRKGACPFFVRTVDFDRRFEVEAPDREPGDGIGLPDMIDIGIDGETVYLEAVGNAVEKKVEQGIDPGGIGGSPVPVRFRFLSAGKPGRVARRRVVWMEIDPEIVHLEMFGPYPSAEHLPEGEPDGT